MSRRASGLRAWVVQRLTAVYVAAFTVAAVLALALGSGLDHGEWVSLVRQPAVSIAILLFFLSLLLHTWVGLRDVLIDYVREPTLRIILLSLLAGGLVACGLWVLVIILSLW